jgi:hypothetical protein
LIKDKIIVFVPHKIISEANNRDHWTKKYKRKVALQWAIKVELSKIQEFPLPCIITLERVGKKNLDFANLVHGFKHAEDMIAKTIIERTDLAPVKPIGVYDGDSRLQWRYGQKSNVDGFGKKHPLGFWITIEEKEIHES